MENHWTAKGLCERVKQEAAMHDSPYSEDMAAETRTVPITLPKAYWVMLDALEKEIDWFSRDDMLSLILMEVILDKIEEAETPEQIVEALLDLVPPKGEGVER